MKTKLLIILLSIIPLLMNGQDAKTSNKAVFREHAPMNSGYYTYSDSAGIHMELITDDMPINGHNIGYVTTKNFEQELLKILTEYETDCYNDSTAVTFGIFRNVYGGGEFKAVHNPKLGEFIGNLIRTEKGYIHRKPNDLGHFINWFHKKTEQ